MSARLFFILALPLALSACGGAMRVRTRALLPFVQRFDGPVEMTSRVPEGVWEIATIEINSEQGLSDTLRELRNRCAAMGCDLVLVDRFETVWQADQSVTVDTYPCGSTTCTRVNRENVTVERLIVHGRGFARHRGSASRPSDSN